MYKTVHGMTPEYLRSRFVSRDDITSYRLGNTENKLALPQSRISYLKKSFSCSGGIVVEQPIPWNSLYHDLRSAASLMILNVNYLTTVLNEFNTFYTRHP